jgi:hypothetical protein
LTKESDENQALQIFLFLQTETLIPLNWTRYLDLFGKCMILLISFFASLLRLFRSSFFGFLGTQFELEETLGLRRYSPALASFVSPAFGATAASATYYATSGLRVAALAGSLGFGAVAATYTIYSVMGTPYGSRGYLFF